MDRILFSDQKFLMFKVLLPILAFTISTISMQTNVLGTALEPCSMNPLTGFFRTGYCETDKNDHGMHTVCAKVTK